MPIVYDRFLEEQQLEGQALENRISQLKAEVQHENDQRHEAIANLNIGRQEIVAKEGEIEVLENEKVVIRNAENEAGDTTPFVIGAFITVLLTLYLFVFYSSSGYSAFYGIKPGSLGFINPDVFSDASNKGGGVIMLIILFPVIFLGLGFLIHDALEKIKAGKGRRSAITTISILLVITFITDAFIGYKISEGVHTNDFNAGRTDSLWKFEMVFSDINFYLVLILGFVVYVIWGFLLNYVLSHPYLKTESDRIKKAIEELNAKISKKKEDLFQINSRIQKLESDIATIENRIAEKQKNIIGYQHGDIPINLASLRASVGEFMGGWQNYTHGNLPHRKAARIVEESIINSTNWLENKIESLNTHR